MNLVPLEVAGAFVLRAEPVCDERGWFARVWDSERLAARGLVARFAQQSVARNARAGTLRGLHVTRPPVEETKIVRCTRGAIHDVVLDARPGSPTFGRYAAVRLDDETPTALYVPAGCAHGYQTLVDGTDVAYDISAAYAADAAAGIAHDDPAVGIAWPLAVTAISARDAALPPLARFAGSLAMEVRP
jgi:dTDP-4-dehydrorhamnose 3,5-epimerase